MTFIAQEVNLYQEKFHPEKETLTIAHCMVVMLVVLAVLAGLSWNKNQQLAQVEQEISNLNQQHEKMMQQLSTLAVTNSQNIKKAVKASEIKTKEQELKTRRELLGSLTGQKYGSTEGFSEYMVALSRQHVEGAWITGLSVIKGGQDLTIIGSSLKPELAPIYLQKLSNEKVFKGKSFAMLKLHRNVSSTIEQNDSKIINFIFRTENGIAPVFEEVN